MPVLLGQLAGRGGPNGLGDGRLDNIVVDRSVHLAVGVAVVVAMLVATALVARHAVRGEPLGRGAGLSLAAAQLVLATQLLIGIKLLDQGQGIVQLYIHYIGGLLPLGLFLVAGWLARGDDGRSTRILCGLLTVGTVSALMAFTIGRAYANTVL
jgi:hypothetical protein